MADSLSLDQVRHVSRLARLHLTDDQLEHFRGQLSSVLEHVAKIGELDVTDVEPMAHPTDIANRLDEDVASSQRVLTIEQLQAIAPPGAMEDRFLAVPKVLDDAPSGGAA
jgi:aspartyl-tRNA(Asn)/glutamyl-tRNA(Gln) amidotransferase subunit C